MKLTKEQTSKLLSQLNDWRKSAKPCVICGQSSWAVNDTIFELREFNEGNLVIGGKCAIMPLVPVTCNNCGNTLFFNAIKLGVVIPPESKVDEDVNSKEAKGNEK